MTDKKPVDHHTHDGTRANIPPAELEPVLDDKDKAPIRVAYDTRNADLDPQLIWRGKDIDQTEISVNAPPIYLQEQVHPKALIEDLRAGREKATDLFGHFGLTEEDIEAEVEFYRHTRKWSNRMILGDGLQVMASLSEREGLRGQVQAIYIDPPYGIKFNSNFQWSTTSRDVKDGKLDHLTREPEQVKAFRDTWRDGIHSYLQYLRDRLVVARELLTESGSCFVQIGDENVHRVRALMDEVFGEGNFVSEIIVEKTSAQTSQFVPNISDFIVFYAKDIERLKYRQLFADKGGDATVRTEYRRIKKDDGTYDRVRDLSDTAWEEAAKIGKVYRQDNITSAKPPGDFPVNCEGVSVVPKNRYWSTGEIGMSRLLRAERVEHRGSMLSYVRYFLDYPVKVAANYWANAKFSSRSEDKTYVVQTSAETVKRCLLMTTDPGDLVLDPTCGSGTTAYVAEQWGRRWITIDTSRVALALARARVMGAKYPYYLLADSKPGHDRMVKEGWATPSDGPFESDLRAGFVYNRVPHITLKAIANNTEIDRLWDQHQPAVEDALRGLNECMYGFPCSHPVDTGGRAGSFIDFTDDDDCTLPSGEEVPKREFQEWEVPRQPGTPMSGEVLDLWLRAAALCGEPYRRTGGSITKVSRQRQRTEESPAKTRELSSVLEELNELSTGGDYYERNTPTGFYFHEGNLLDLSRGEDEIPILPWPTEAEQYLKRFWDARITRQRAIDAAIEKKGREDDYEVLYDKPFEDKKRVRVAGPFTVESLSPHKSAAVDENGELIDEIAAADGTRLPEEREAENYRRAIMENLEKAGVHQRAKEDAIRFETLTPWPGEWIAAEGQYREGEAMRRAGIFIGPEYGTVQRADLVACTREAADAGFDVVIACAFNFEAHAQEFNKLGRIPILQARMNPDLHMAGDLKAGGGNLFVVFGEPDISIETEGDRLRVRLKGVDIFKPAKGIVESSEADEIACWFIDTDYSGESFFVRHAYFPGADIPYKQLRTTLKGEVDEEAWESLKLTVSRPFARPKSGRIAVKVINHLGDEVMKVFSA